jgi:hypothetical protein
VPHPRQKSDDQLSQRELQATSADEPTRLHGSEREHWQDQDEDADEETPTRRGRVVAQSVRKRAKPATHARREHSATTRSRRSILTGLVQQLVRRASAFEAARRALPELHESREDGALLHYVLIRRRSC